MPPETFLSRELVDNMAILSEICSNAKKREGKVHKKCNNEHLLMNYLGKNNIFLKK